MSASAARGPLSGASDAAAAAHRPGPRCTASCRTCPARRWPPRRSAADADEPDRRELEDVGRSLRGERAVPPVAPRRRSTRPTCTPPAWPPRSTTWSPRWWRPDARVDVDVSGADVASCPAVALSWRVAQESVRNVARHARADRMSLTVRHEDDRLVLEVVDDGVGFDPATVRRPTTTSACAQPRASCASTAAPGRSSRRRARARWSGWRCRSDDPAWWWPTTTPSYGAA